MAVDYMKINYDFIEEYCVNNNQTAWLKELVLNPTAKGKKITFIEVKKAFVNKFMPEIAPKAKPKKPSMFDRVAKL